MSTTLDDLVKRWAELDDQKAQIETEQAAIKAKLREQLERGSHELGGLSVTISAPARRFNVETARAFLTAEQVELCTVSSLDAKKVKGFLPPVLLDQAMDAGSGDDVVKIS